MISHELQDHCLYEFISIFNNSDRVGDTIRLTDNKRLYTSDIISKHKHWGEQWHKTPLIEVTDTLLSIETYQLEVRHNANTFYNSIKLAFSSAFELANNEMLRLKFNRGIIVSKVKGLQKPKQRLKLSKEKDYKELINLLSNSIELEGAIALSLSIEAIIRSQVGISNHAGQMNLYESVIHTNKVKNLCTALCELNYEVDSFRTGTNSTIGHMTHLDSCLDDICEMIADYNNQNEPFDEMLLKLQEIKHSTLVALATIPESDEEVTIDE
ncbi:hypothetical protein VCHA53O466_40230 [Vibrio chagasii]|nr:hypothetical protein VCHA53O466_40230 [Vibrio chagasii]